MQSSFPFQALMRLQGQENENREKISNYFVENKNFSFSIGFVLCFCFFLLLFSREKFPLSLALEVRSELQKYHPISFTWTLSQKRINFRKSLEGYKCLKEMQDESIQGLLKLWFLHYIRDIEFLCNLAIMNIYIDLFNGFFVSMIVGHGQNVLSWLSIILSVVI